MVKSLVQSIMGTPKVNFSNIIKTYKTSWFVTESEFTELRNTYVFQNTPLPTSDIYGGLYLGVARDDFDGFLAGSKKYRAVAVCDDIMRKIRSMK